MRQWTEDEIVSLINTNNQMVCISLVQMYNQQTDDEKLYKETSHDNGIGFSACDSRILSSFAEFYLKNGYLSSKQISIARPKLVRYRKQILRLANAHEHKKATEHDLKNLND